MNYEIMKKYFCIVLLLFSFSACTRHFTTYSNVNVSTSEMETVQQIAHNTFIELEYQGGQAKVLTWDIGKEIYNVYWYYNKLLMLSGNQSFYLDYTVKFKYKKNDTIEISIKNGTAYASKEERVIIRQKLDDVVALLNKRFQEAKLQVEINKGLNWTPKLLHGLP